jgi:hypothetical protein
MRAINHAMTGAVIGLAVSEPFLAIPLAIASHFVLDAIPHHGERTNSFTSPVFRILLVSDAILCFALVVVLIAVHPKHWLLAAFCALAAAGVDFMQAPRYFRSIHGKPEKPRDIIGRFHGRIQWYQRPPGAAIEIAWAAAAIVVLVKLMRA